MARNTLKTDEDTETQGRSLAKITLKAGGGCGPEPGVSGRIFLLPKLLPLPPRYGSPPRTPPPPKASLAPRHAPLMAAGGRVGGRCPQPRVPSIQQTFSLLFPAGHCGRPAQARMG